MSMTDIKSAKNHGVLQQQCSILCMQKLLLSTTAM